MSDIHNGAQRGSKHLVTVEMGEKQVFLLGTAHISQESVDAVTQAINEIAFEHVVIEIDEQRYRTMKDRKSWESLNIFQIIRKRKMFLLLCNVILASFQRRIGADIGVLPGAEMLAAIQAAQQKSIPFSFGDRAVPVTLRRAWAKSGFWGRNKLLATLIALAFSRQKLNENELRDIRQQGQIDTMLQELADYMPAVKKVLIDERDMYLAQSIINAEGKRVLAVVGAGHVAGISRLLHEYAENGKSVDIAALNHVPPRTILQKSIPFVVPVLVLGIIFWGFLRGGADVGLQTLFRWVVVNGSLSAFGALLALGHPITIITSFLAAPITSMNPTIGVGFVTGLLEALLRKPRVSDFENLTVDAGSVRGFYRNRLTRILLVFFLSTIGSAIGTFIALPLLLS